MLRRVIIGLFSLYLVAPGTAAVLKTLVDGKVALVDGKASTSLSVAAEWVDPDNPLILYQFNLNQTNLFGFDNVGSLAGLDANTGVGSAREPAQISSNGNDYIHLDGGDFTTTTGFPLEVTNLSTYTESFFIRFATNPGANQAMVSRSTNTGDFGTFWEMLSDTVGVKGQAKMVMKHNGVNAHSMETPSGLTSGMFLALSNWCHVALVQPNDGNGPRYYINGHTNVNGFTVSNDRNKGFQELFNATDPVDRITIGGLQGATFLIPITADFDGYALYGTNLSTLSITNQWLRRHPTNIVKEVQR